MDIGLYFQHEFSNMYLFEYDQFKIFERHYNVSRWWLGKFVLDSEPWDAVTFRNVKLKKMCLKTVLQKLQYIQSSKP